MEADELTTSILDDVFLNDQGYTGVLGCGAGQHGGFDTFLKFLSFNASLNEQG
jgi:hypothetical protein